MKEYQKIETLYKFNPKEKKFDKEFYNPIVEYLKDLPWIASEKIDGMNIRVHWDGHKIEYNGRTDNCNLPKEVEELLLNTFRGNEIIFEQTFGGKDVFLFMECYGGKVQGKLYGGKERLIGFDVMVDGVYLDKLKIKGVFDSFNVETISFFQVDTLYKAIELVKQGNVSNHCELNKTIVEGLVCVPKCRLYDHQGNRIIVKIKYRDLKNMRE